MGVTLSDKEFSVIYTYIHSIQPQIEDPMNIV